MRGILTGAQFFKLFLEGGEYDDGIQFIRGKKPVVVQPLVPAKLELAAPPHAEKTDIDNVPFVVRVYRIADKRDVSNINVDIQFLLQLPLQRLLEGFAKINAAPRQQPVHVAFFSMRNEKNFSVFDDNCGNPDAGIFKF